MKRVNIFQIILELIVILGFVVVGITLLTYLFQKVVVDRILLGLVISAVGLFGLTEYCTLKYIGKLKSIANLVISILAVAFGIITIIIKFEMSQLCVIGAWFAIGYSAGRIITCILNLLRQPLLSGIRIILAITTVVFSIFFLIKNTTYINSYLTFLGIAFLIEGATLFVEFLIHRYQN